jgi:hypothetical protein
MYSLQAEVLGFFRLRFRTSDRYDRRDRYDPEGDLWSVNDSRRHHHTLSTTVPLSHISSRIESHFKVSVFFRSLHQHTSHYDTTIFTLLLCIISQRLTTITLFTVTLK